MDQQKIGKFIAQRRKQAGLTQAQLAEQLNITDRAVSKWETGKALPDTSIMLELCQILNITVNDLLTGEIVTMDQYNKKTGRQLAGNDQAKGTCRQTSDIAGITRRRILNIHFVRHHFSCLYAGNG